MTAVIIFSLFIPSLLLAAPTLKLTEGADKYPLGKYLSLLEDREGKWSIEEVSSPAFSGRFVPNKTETLNLFWKTRSAVWVRFQVTNPLAHPKPMILQLRDPLLSQALLFLPEDQGSFEVKKTGRVYPFSQREIPNRNFLLTINMPAHSDRTFYLRLKTDCPSQGE
jgi:hypothetical protein